MVDRSQVLDRLLPVLRRQRLLGRRELQGLVRRRLAGAPRRTSGNRLPWRLREVGFGCHQTNDWVNTPTTHVDQLPRRFHFGKPQSTASIITLQDCPRDWVLAILLKVEPWNTKNEAPMKMVAKKTICVMVERPVSSLRNGHQHLTNPAGFKSGSHNTHGMF